MFSLYLGNKKENRKEKTALLNKRAEQERVEEMNSPLSRNN